MQTGRPRPAVRRGDILQAEALLEATLWITVSRGNVGGRRCRDYAVCDAAGQALLAARAFVWGRELPVTAAGTDRRVLLLRRRRLFPITGRVDVLEPERGAALGAVYRSGRFAPARGGPVGRFRDARTLPGRAAEGVLSGFADALIGNDGSQLSSSTAFSCTIAEQPAGTLALAPLSWTPESRPQPPALAALAGRWLPERARRALKSVAAPTGWRFERAPALLGVDPRLVIGAALFQVELAQW